jgi:hypothetical protein
MVKKNICPLFQIGPGSYLFEEGRRSILTQSLQYSKHDWRLHDMCPISLDKPDIHKVSMLYIKTKVVIFMWFGKFIAR